MKKFSVSAVLTGVLLGLPGVVGAAYPVYQNYPGAVNNGQMMYLPSTNSRVVSAPNGYNMPYNSVVAAQPTRVTGALPRVGSAQTVAGRQYYQPADYDRLADSGLYVGLSVGYSASVIGSIGADYIGETDSYTVPGAFRDADFDSDTVIPLQVSVGAAINNDIRVDFSYLRYSNLSYPRTVQTADGEGGYVTAQVDGGGVDKGAQAVLLQIFDVGGETGQTFFGVKPVGERKGKGTVQSKNVLVRQHGAKLTGIHRAGNGLYMHKIASDLFGVAEQENHSLNTEYRGAGEMSMKKAISSETKGKIQ